jgi:ATP-dependent RNA helicase DDX47/RRP3
MLVPFKFKQTYLVALLSHFKQNTGIIFIDTCLNAQKLTIILRHLGFSAVCLHGQMTQVQRLGALNQFRSGNRKFLIATGVASRGLDIPAVDLVVNYDLPKNQKDYIHRVGRTARAGKSGRAFAMVTQYDVENFQKIEQALGKKLDDFAEISESVAMAFHERVLEAARTAHLELKEKQEEILEGLGPGAKNNKKLKVKKMLLRK